MPLTAFADVQTLQFLYFERPPYHYTDNGTPTGFMIDPYKSLFIKNDIPVSFSSMPPSRILSVLSHSDSYACSTGWFKNNERLKIYNYSDAIIVDQPLSVVIDRKKEKEFRKKENFADLISDNSLKVGKATFFSYGIKIDELIDKNKNSLTNLSVNQSQLLSLLQKGRVDYLLMRETETNFYIKESNLVDFEFIHIKYPDIDKSINRYTICSEDVPISILNVISQVVIEPKNR